MTLEAGVLINQNVRLTRLLGQGGMGAVWLADHLTLRTQVAVKFILADFTTDADALDRFTREATSAAKIKSPNVVQVLDHGLFQGLPYILMEFLEGEDLDVRIARGPLALGDLAPILQQVGKALTQAHGLGIVHRDIKPANVYLTTAGDDLLVKLLDLLPISPERGELTSRCDHPRARKLATSRRDHQRPRQPATSRRDHRGPRQPATSHHSGRRDHFHSRRSLTSPTDLRAITADRAPR